MRITVLDAQAATVHVDLDVIDAGSYAGLRLTGPEQACARVLSWIETRLDENGHMLGRRLSAGKLLAALRNAPFAYAVIDPPPGVEQ